MIRAGYVQFTPEFGDVEGNTERLRALLGQGRGADLLVLPELALTGYLFKDRAELLRLAEPVAGVAAERLCSLAQEVDAHLVVGIAELDGERAYNSAVLVNPERVVGVYRKTHLFAEEKDLFEPGDSGFQVWDVAGARVGVMLCFDWIFPESVRTLALRGANVIAHPSNLVLPHCQRVMPARCLENRVFAVTANRCGTERRGDQSLRFTGGSVIVGPGGDVLHAAPVEGDEVAVAEVHLAAARNKYITPRNHLLDDRRPDLYEH